MKKISRRTFVGRSVKGALGLITVSVIPINLAACSNDSVDTSAMANLGTLAELKQGPFPKTVKYLVKIKDAWVEQEREGFVYVHLKNDELLIMPPICTHLGCTAGAADESKQKDRIKFFCPCH
ncbi:ubiquinol-cytochrome c reductase iron-sulfur subunit [Radiobacillus sp. PE A8.2]|uniref:ubiquinol-cytochrome c reductase iron-sulfur subunit n=1 Tax=Radiobacillus sp. PE A8.2 TaxID=3380349 RepID=UPI00388ED6D6